MKYEQGGPAVRQRRRGFSLTEVMLAFAILGVGLVMVAAVFPVGADWTRQSVEETVGAVVARNAVNIIQVKYPLGLGVGGGLQALPGITGGSSARLPATERAYGFGRNIPYPMAAGTAGAAAYCWTALARQSPGSTNRYDLYILVFKKGGAEQTFTPPGSGPIVEVAGCRDLTNDPKDASNKQLLPYVVMGSLGDALFPMGSQGIGVASGTVFRKLGTGPNIPLAGNEGVIYAPPSDGATVSPLVYIYQTTLGY